MLTRLMPVRASKSVLAVMPEADARWVVLPSL